MGPWYLLMKLIPLKLLVTAGCFLIPHLFSNAQSFSFNCSRDTILPGCPPGQCFTLKAVIPDIHGLSTSYSVNPGSFTPNCFPVYVAPNDPLGTPTNLTIDDRYSGVIGFGFNFPFFGTTYSNLVASTNGYISFNTALANGSSHWQDRGDLPNALYDGAVIMGPYHDLDPSITTSPTRRIQYQTWGVAPCRRWILSFYRVPLFNCGSLFENTHQIILYESTGIVEVKIFDKQICGGWNNGKAMVGMQDITKTLGLTAPGRRMSDPPWGTVGMNETWRFVPDAGNSLLKRVELTDLGGAIISTGTTAPLSPGTLDVSFANVCPPAGAVTSYVVRSVYEKIDDPAVEIFGLDTIRVDRQNPLSATATPTGANCGTPNGTITVSGVTGGTPAYEYSLDGVNWQAGNVFTGLTAGTYTVYIRDNGAVCTLNITVTVPSVGNIPATTTNTATACFGASTGTITITSAGGTGPYTFSLDGGAPVAGTLPYTFTGLSAGSHTVLVNDLGTGCNTGPLTVTIATGSGVNGTATSSPTACPAVSTGSITVSASIGTPPFTWSLDGGPFLPGASPYTFSSVSGGPHNVTIRDANNCSIIVPVNVLFGVGVTASSVVTGTSCPAVNDGSATITVVTGLAPYTFSLDGGPAVPGGSPFVYNGLAPGSHNVTVTDNVGCNILVPFTITAGSSPTAVVNSTATACAGVNNGTITIASTTMAGPYTFSLDGGAPFAGTLPYTFSGVAAGSHTVLITGSGGCATPAIPVTVATGPGVTGNASSSATSCPAAANGSILVNASSGTGPFTYQLDGGAPQSGANPYTFSNVPAGTHTVIITDALGCTWTDNNVVVAAGPVLTATTASTATSCSGASNGSVTVSPVGGAAPFTFSLDGGAAVAGTPPFTFTNLSAGNHTIIVTDAAGCATNPILVNVAAGPALTTTSAVTDVLCNGGNTGTITVATPAMGTAPYEYSLDNINWQAGNVFNGLSAGPYTVYYREANGCQGSHTQTVNEPAALTATSTEVAVSCNGGTDGTITLTPAGGIAPYQYSIDGGANWQPSNVFTVAAGNYTVLIRDLNGCTTTGTMAVTEPPVLTANAVVTAASCNGGNDGTITVTATGGNSNYQYSLDGVNFQSSNLFNVAPGSYTVVVRDNLGCNTSVPATVGLGNNLTYTTMTDATICEGSSVQLNFVSNATVYAWAPAAGLSDAAVPNPVASPTSTTQYIVSATLDRCNITDTVMVFVNPAPLPDAGTDAEICYGQTYRLQGSGGLQYAWTPAATLDNPALASPVSSARQTTTYTLSILSDNNGCPSLVTDDMVLTVTPPVKVYTYPADTIAYPGDQIQLRAVSAVPAANQFTWSPPFNLDNPFIYNPTVTAGNAGDSIVYKVTAASPAGCLGEGYVLFRVYKGPDLYTPTAFTPNGDGLNDRFYPFPVGIKSINYFRVFNRWGQLVFSSNTLYQGWDGKFNGQAQAAGVYVWMTQGLDKNNKLITKQGTITLIR